MKSFYRVPKNLKNDISDYEKSLHQFLNNEMHPTQFRAIRVPFGVYEQRINNTFMMRIRIPAGGVLPEQMERIARLSKKFGSGILHTTTRQDIQIHKVSLEDSPTIMNELLEVGLTTKGGGGNTVRNITACSDSGVCEKEVFDCSPHAIALTEYLIKDSRSYSLPRKFKVAFSGCPLDCALATVNDVGFIAVEKEINGKKRRGFKVYVAGGMGVSSRIAQLLENFVEEDEIIDITEALKRLFDKNGNRRNKNKARMRFLIEKLGKDEFMRIYRQELAEIKKNGGIKPDIRKLQSDPAVIGIQAEGNPVEDSDEDDYKTWFDKNVITQRQSGYYSVRISLPLGDISSDSMISLAASLRNSGENSIRATNEQNLLLRWVHESELRNIFSKLKPLGLAGSAALVNEMICCAGSSTCRLGLCLSRNLSEAISKEFESACEIFKDVSIKISGCPNSCGHHPIGGIGLFGAVRRIGDDLAPYYNISLGGRVEEGKTVLGEEIGLAHAKDIPKIILKFIQTFNSDSKRSKDYYEYIETKGKKVMKSILKEFSSIPSYKENNNYYCDWGTQGKFSLAGRGAGECGAGIFDIIEVDFEEAASALEKAASADSPKNSSINLYEAINRVSRALLVTRGAEAQNDLEAFELFEKEFIDSGLVQSSFAKLIFLASEFKKGNLNYEAIIDKQEQIREFAATIKSLYDSMDDSLQFKTSDKTEEEKNQPAKEVKKSSGIELFDLRGVKCPFNYVKAKLKLEMMEIGDELEIFLDDGEPLRNVPNSLKNDGQELTEPEKVDGYYKFVLTKKV